MGFNTSVLSNQAQALLVTPSHQERSLPKCTGKIESGRTKRYPNKNCPKNNSNSQFYMQNGERQDESSKQNLQKRNENERKKTINKARSKQGEEQKEFKNETQEGRTRQGEHKKRTTERKTGRKIGIKERKSKEQHTGIIQETRTKTKTERKPEQ